MQLPLFLMVFVNVYIHFRIWTRIRNPRVTDPEKFPDPCRSGSTTLVINVVWNDSIRQRYLLCSRIFLKLAKF
jgi:hypothetical protein